jgi:FAD/FMN-containing dehydrogenase
MRLSVAAGRHVRVVGTAHTGTKAICVENGNAISTERLDSILGIEQYRGQEVVHVQAGARIWDVAEFLHTRGKALGYNIPGYGDMTVGGFLAVGGHGSNAQGSATISSLVVAIDKMGPAGEVTTYDEVNAAPGLWRALRADLGLLGMTVAVRLRLRDQFHVRQRILTLTAEEVFRPDGIKQVADGCEYLFATYFHSAGRMAVTCGAETSDPVTAEDARMTLFTPEFGDFLETLAVVAFQAGACDPEIARRNELLLYAYRQANPWIEWTDAAGQPRRGTEAVGHSHRMVEIVFRGISQPKYTSRDCAVALPESEIDQALQYVRSQLDEHRLYNPAIGMILRADRANADSLLGPSAAGDGLAAGERVYYLEFPVFVPYEFTPQQLAAYEAPYAEMLLYLTERHRGRPHFGKSRSDLFWEPAALASTSERRALFQPWIDLHDPYGVYANDFLRRAGFSWPRDGQDWVPEYFPGWAGARLGLRNVQEKLCLQSRYKTRARTQPCDGAPDQRFYLFEDGLVLDPAGGELLDPAPAPQPGVRYSVRPVADLRQCLEKANTGGVVLRDCDEEAPILKRQLWSFIPAGGGSFKLKSASGGLAPCARALKGSAAVGGAICSDVGQKPADRNRKRWTPVQP